ncbi:MAG: hypothetical protein WDN04_11910 [Rhodospirillales bacterium]
MAKAAGSQVFGSSPLAMPFFQPADDEVQVFGAAPLQFAVQVGRFRKAVHR